MQPLSLAKDIIRSTWCGHVHGVAKEHPQTLSWFRGSASSFPLPTLFLFHLVASTCVTLVAVPAKAAKCRSEIEEKRPFAVPVF